MLLISYERSESSVCEFYLVLQKNTVKEILVRNLPPEAPVLVASRSAAKYHRRFIKDALLVFKFFQRRSAGKYLAKEREIYRYMLA